jgi:hypothetical protein
MKVKDWVVEHIGTLEHFIEQGAYPIRIRADELASLESMLPKAFKTKDGITSCNVKEIPSKVMAIFWKIKYEEAKSDANKMYNAIDEAYRKANS